jgi:flagellar hook-associated protein 1 FlgK
MGTSIFGIGVTALNTAQIGITTTEHNIANASTPGFSRQQAVQTANPPQFSGAGFMGQGVNVSTIKRMYSEFLGAQVLQEQAQANQLDTYYTEIQQINNLLADASAGLAPAIQGFFSGVNTVATTPQSQAGRQTMLSSAQVLVSRFQALGQRMADVSAGLNSQITTSVAAINGYAQQIAALNDSIVLAQGTSGGMTANDLLDQRDQLITQLNVEVKATVLKQTDGSYNVFIGNGQALVVGSGAYTLQAAQNQQDASRLDLAYSSNGQVIRLPQSAIQGGKLGGLMNFRAQTLDATQNSLGRLAIGLASNFNAQHQLGLDANGALGGNFFNVPVPSVAASVVNAGTGAVSATIANVAALTTSDYQLIFNGGTSYSVLRMSDNTLTNFPAGLPQTVDGVTLALTGGAPVAGDTFLIRPTASGAGSISLAVSNTNLIAAASPVRSGAALANTGSGAISSATVNATPVLANPAHPATDLNLQQPVTITFNNPPTTFNVAGVGVPLPGTNIPFTAGAPITYNGWTVSISGAPKAGDVFSVGTNSLSTADGSNALLLAGLQTRPTLSNSTASYEGAYAQLVGEVGNKTRELKVTSQAQTTLVNNTIQQQQSISGVNLDEEAANLMRFQRAYQAAGQAIKVANTMFDTLLSLR